MGARRIRRNQRQADMKSSRIVNGMAKTKERSRRQTRILGLIKGHRLPFSPVVMSWLSETLNKPGRLITQADVDQLLKKSQ